ncbi:hypothetical protein [Hymenobacter canadensis]|uniref:Uncharacterized protein n=1 Tax=Hymenobacter canadensis TaxID=2999067 RepID=A0ABY7LVQ5_9BACT|nr:hypothetical protein [Hymenobacter canadensis]WBA44156.1 hypothetical protein O3303_19905 [Hymenobacter canadensis]
MNQDLQQSLDENAKQWQALSLTISTSEKVAFDAQHDHLFTTHGSSFMAHVYRTAFEQVLQHTPDDERRKLLGAFQQAMEGAIAARYSTHPSAAECHACHSRMLLL